MTNEKHHQPRLSLKTRDYLEAVGIASQLARAILDIPNPTIDQVKAVYAQFVETKAEFAMRLNAVDMGNLLSDLAVKSQREYLSVWNSFITSVDGGSLSVCGVTQQHIDLWKQTQTCSDATLKKKLRLLSSCFKRSDIASESDWFRFKVKVSTKERRRAFTDNEITLIFKSTTPYRYGDNSWRYYLPRLALLTGCRLNELAQLRVGDIQFGVSPSISINRDGIDKKVKNESSIRVLPLCCESVKLLNEIVDAKPKTQRIFPELPYSEVNGYTSKPSKFFSRLSRDLFGERNVSFHSFRHYVITHLFNSGVREELIGSLVGHSVGKLMTGKVYLSGFNYNAKLEAMNHMSSVFRFLEVACESK